MKLRSFQLHLMRRMREDVRATALKAFGITAHEADELERCSPIRLPDRGETSIAQYEEVLGRAVRREMCPDLPRPFSGSTSHAFVLPYWPHLFFVVYEQSNGGTWGAGLQNQFNPPRESTDPATFRYPLVTLRLLRQLAHRFEPHDGWDEAVTERFEFSGGVYEGDFVWELLQDWRRVS